MINFYAFIFGVFMGLSGYNNSAVSDGTFNSSNPTASSVPIVGTIPPPTGAAEKPVVITTHDEMLSWYKGAKFGMFIHWGIFSDIGKGEWALVNIPGYNNGLTSGLDNYKAHANNFNSAPDNIAKIVTLAKTSGMRYIVLVTRHHDGFNLWNTSADAYSTKFNSTQFGSKRDVVKIFADECQKQGIKLVLYYSLLDWMHPSFPDVAASSTLKIHSKQAGDWDAYRTFMKTQLTELLTNYGQIAGIWFDGHWSLGDNRLWRMEDLYASIHKAQAVTLIGNNLGGGTFGDTPGTDFTIGERRAAQGDPNAAGETVDTSQVGGDSPGGTWGYVSDATIQPREWIFENLIGSISSGKNFVLNIGPRADGTWQKAIDTEFIAVGSWLQKNEEAVYGSQAGIPDYDSTTKVGADGKTYLYLFIRDAKATTISLPTAFVDVRNALPLVTGGATIPLSLPVRKDSATTIVDFSSLARIDREPLVLKLDATVRPYSYVSVISSAQAVASATSNWIANEGYGPEKAIDDDPSTRWASNAPTPTLTLNFVKPTKIDAIKLQEYFEDAEGSYRVGSFTIEAKVEDQWQQVTSGTGIGKQLSLFLNKPVSASALRINLTSKDGRGPPSLYTFIALARK
ncbi:alpha-L-fucosidase [Rhizobium tubonense]|uniref:alpha-L-fucosidase n=1 Tax=Rhizobium tubonense TaxID=484088 RepID=A0A2W4D215_9HYPH|nr:alpha-L-fucosidase [Rhizobium tubonense]PZM16948.1 hypothetical protein CPY51_01485 [Rhizobium tubonense]